MGAATAGHRRRRAEPRARARPAARRHRARRRWSWPLAAQVAVPVPFSPVPMTLQPLAVLAVGGLLGAAGGARGARALPRARRCSGFPVFAGGSAGRGAPARTDRRLPAGVPGRPPRVAGALVAGRDRASLRVLGACALGMVVIHAGGVAQLALLGGDPAAAFRVGFVPFFTGDLLKVGLAAAADPGPPARRLARVH